MEPTVKKCLHLKRTKNRKSKPAPTPKKSKPINRPRSVFPSDGTSMSFAAAAMLMGAERYSR